jgi:hypothetical protein
MNVEAEPGSLQDEEAERADGGARVKPRGACGPCKTPVEEAGSLESDVDDGAAEACNSNDDDDDKVG